MSSTALTKTGLHYNRYRYYSSYIGRFVSKDPIGLDGGFNIYQYAPNSIQWVDTLGLNKYFVGSLDQMPYKASEKSLIQLYNPNELFVKILILNIKISR